MQEVNVQFEVRPIVEENRPAIRRLLQQVTHAHSHLRGPGGGGGGEQGEAL